MYQKKKDGQYCPSMLFFRINTKNMGQIFNTDKYKKYRTIIFHSYIKKIHDIYLSTMLRLSTNLNNMVKIYITTPSVSK
jgi:hypothetical protein